MKRVPIRTSDVSDRSETSLANFDLNSECTCILPISDSERHFTTRGFLGLSIRDSKRDFTTGAFWGLYF